MGSRKNLALEAKHKTGQTIESESSKKPMRALSILKNKVELKTYQS
jgi:hypothetical protein